MQFIRQAYPVDNVVHDRLGVDFSIFRDGVEVLQWIASTRHVGVLPIHLAVNLHYMRENLRRSVDRQSEARDSAMHYAF